ncbi:MAG: hypothetical protein AB8F95_14975 [Bacteroidia bacterium]
MAPKKLHYIIPVLCVLVYLLFPTANSSVDSWGYAADIKWSTDLFAPHHLLYNAWGWLIHQLIRVDTLSLMKALNALVAAGCVATLGSILAKRKVADEMVIGWMLFAGGSFGVMRFATENETYLVPLLISLLASRIVLMQGSRIGAIALMAGFLAAGACLFHQLHVWWWLGLLLFCLFTKSRKEAFLYALPAILVPLVYAAVLYQKSEQVPSVSAFMSFVLHDFSREGVQVDLGLKSLFLTPVSLFRTFFQVHGSVFLFLKKMPWLWLTAGLTAFCLGKGLLRRWPVTFRKGPGDAYQKAHGAILIMHLGFAMLSHGNAEFMVMIPFLIPIVNGWSFRFNPKTIIWLAAAFWVWNLSLDIIPRSRVSLYDFDTTVTYLHRHPEAALVPADKHQIANRYFYSYHKTVYHRLYALGDSAVCDWNGPLVSDMPDRPLLLSREAFLTMLPGKGLETKRRVKTLQGYEREYGLWEIDKKCE